MSIFKSLEMASAVSTSPNISIKKSWFSTKVIYTPTASTVKSMMLEYSPLEGQKVEQLLGMPLEQMAAEIEQNGKPLTGVNGNFRLDVCLSQDHQFCALQLSRFINYSYQPLFPPRIYEGKDVEHFAKLL